jgi:hypothetical protein
MPVSLLVLAPAQGADKADKGKIPITTASEDARKAYLEARDLNEKLRAGDARLKFQEAVAKDPKFALAHLGAANTSITAQEFWDELKKAGELAAGASGRAAAHPVRRGQRQGRDGQGHQAGEHHRRQVPARRTGAVLLGGLYFGRQQWDEGGARVQEGGGPSIPNSPRRTISSVTRCVSWRKYDEAEKAFQKLRRAHSQ